MTTGKGLNVVEALITKLAPQNARVLNFQVI